MKTKTNSGMSLLSTLGVVFVVLKLTDNITWSWFWVLSPFWLPVFVFFALLLVAFYVFEASNLQRWTGLASLIVGGLIGLKLAGQL